ncbi:SH3 domain-binding glutamic acid-rich [Nymphon striatum]|nr:SH3 domain-binding glutamic acid-rich [Nymphon striatum]
MSDEFSKRKVPENGDVSRKTARCSAQQVAAILDSDDEETLGFDEDYPSDELETDSDDNVDNDNDSESDSDNENPVDRLPIKKHQQRVLLILDSKNIKYELVDITQPDQEDAKELMRNKAKALREGQPPITPQIFNDDQYCGDYDDFDLANEDDQLFQFLKLEPEEISSAQQELEDNKISNGSGSRASSETPAEANSKLEETYTGNSTITNESEESSDQEVSAPLSDDVGTQNTNDVASISPSNQEEKNVKHVVIDEFEEIGEFNEENLSPLNEKTAPLSDDKANFSAAESEEENENIEEILGGEKSFEELSENNNLNAEIQNVDEKTRTENELNSQSEAV